MAEMQEQNSNCSDSLALKPSSIHSISIWNRYNYIWLIMVERITSTMDSPVLFPFFIAGVNARHAVAAYVTWAGWGVRVSTCSACRDFGQLAAHQMGPFWWFLEGASIFAHRILVKCDADPWFQLKGRMWAEWGDQRYHPLTKNRIY